MAQGNADLKDTLLSVSAEDKAEATKQIATILESTGLSKAQSEEEAGKLTDFSGLNAQVKRLQQETQKLATAYAKVWQSAVVPKIKELVEEQKAKAKVPPQESLYDKPEDAPKRAVERAEYLKAVEAFTQFWDAPYLKQSQTAISKMVASYITSTHEDEIYAGTNSFSGNYRGGHQNDVLLEHTPLSLLIWVVDSIKRYGYEKAKESLHGRLHFPFPSPEDAAGLVALGNPPIISRG